jgi:uncharacterized protein YdcH (DUF465 family)
VALNSREKPSPGLSVRVKLLVEAYEELKDKIKSVYNGLNRLELIPSKELKWTKLMLGSKIGPQIEGIRLLLLSSQRKSGLS